MKRTNKWLPVAFAVTAVALTQRIHGADQDVTLSQTPIYSENFDELAEGTLPPGWSVTNETDTVTPGDNLDDLKSDTYKNWVVVSADRIFGLKSEVGQIPSITLNGQPLDALASGNMIYAESDVRDGNQVQYLFTKDYDLTGKTNVYLVFNSLYDQNQDNINGLEYSIDGGNTWLPALYYLYGGADNGQGGPDIITNSVGNVDLPATLSTARSDQAQGKAYGAFLAAPVTPQTAFFIQPRINDDPLDGKRIEFVRLEKADNQSKVRFRFFQAGTGSWYWGIDNLGIYSLPEARVVFPPHTLPDWGHVAQINAGTDVTFHVDVSGQAPITYQWAKDGTDIPGATSSSLVITKAKSSDAGLYTVTVKNSLGQQTSDPGQLLVLSSPQITTQPSGTLVSAGAPISLSVTASGPGTLSYKWQRNNADIPNATNATYSVASATATDNGVYDVVVSNQFGSTTSSNVNVTVFTGTITNDLVVHLPFDSNATDTSGHNNSGSPESQTLADGTDAGLPAYAGGGAQRVGSGALHIKDGQAINLGQPADLSFGPDVNFSVSFWVKAADANAWTGDPSFFSNKNWDSGSSQGYVLAAQGNGAWKWNWRAADGPRRDVGFPSIADNTWHNIVVSHDRQGNAAFYVDGVLKGTQTIAGDGDIDSFGLSTYIGQDGTGGYGFANDTGAHFKDIWIDDFGIWRRALTPQEAASIYAQGLKGQDLTTAAETASTGGTSPRIAIAQGSGNLTISVAGTGTFQLQKKASLNDATWTPVGAPSNSGTFTVAADGTAGFFRVLQQ